MRFKFPQLIACFVLLSLPLEAAVSTRELVSFDRAWKFHLGESVGAEKTDFKDSNWRSLDIPHDWMIAGVVGKNTNDMEGPFDKHSPAADSGAYLNGGVGWYRKTFKLSEADKGKQISILFDGAYMNSKVWLNGKMLGERPYGYSSFYYDLTSEIHFGKEENLLAVRLNVEQPCSRYYSGAGLYRHVWLIATEPVHVAQWGTYVTTPKASAAGSEVRVQTKVRNDSVLSSEVQLTTRLLDADGNEVGRKESHQPIKSGSQNNFDQTITLANAKLWSPETPILYRAVNEVRVNGILTDTTTTPFGIRTIKFTKDKGFFLNGQRVQIKGVCNHHDLGCLGAVALRRGFERQLEILKSMGCNAIRTSHNPPAPELLDLCDEMGFFVMDEAFDEWKLPKRKLGYGRLFDEWSDTDLAAMVDRDRNHPSIILWSIGNEILEQKSKVADSAEAMSRHLVEVCHREDPTRPVTSACHHPDSAWFTGLAKSLDVFGINYSSGFYCYNDQEFLKRQTNDPSAEYRGELPMIGSETASAVSSRGEYGLTLDAQGNLQRNVDLNFQVPEYCNTPEKFINRAEAASLAVQKSPWVAGEFVWTGFDYLGEPTPYQWPARSSYFGMLDLCGFPKDRFYFYQALWSDKPVVHLLPHWTWPGFEGKPIPVWVYANADSVELFLNGHSLGEKKFSTDTERITFPKAAKPKTTNAIGELPLFPPTPETLHLAWSVPYAPGVLKAVAKKNARIVSTDEARTAGVPATITLTPDRTEIIASGQDLSFVKVSILDKDGNVCPNADNEIDFTINDSAAEIAGLDNGDATNHEPFQGARHKTFHGLALVVLKSHFDTTGTVTVSAASRGLAPATLKILVASPPLTQASTSGLLVPNSESSSLQTVPAPKTFLLDGRSLQTTRRKVFAKDPTFAKAITKLRRDADQAMRDKFVAVTDKNFVAPSGDKHDYFSLSTYYWPNPATSNGLPYILRDGEMNPENKSYDCDRLGRMCHNVEALTRAYYLTGEESYADRAVQQLRRWFLNPATRMNPNLNYAQMVKGKNLGSRWGIIDTWKLVSVVDGVALLEGSKSWSAADTIAMQKWFSDYLTWLRTSDLGIAEAKANNNHAVYYDVQLADFALFTGQTNLARDVLAEAGTKRIQTQIEPDGSMPAELARTKSLSYSLFNLNAFFTLARLGEIVDVDLWNYHTADGRSVRSALDCMTPFAIGQKPWTHKQITKQTFASMATLFRQAAIACQEPAYEKLVTRVKGADQEILMNELLQHGSVKFEK